MAVAPPRIPVSYTHLDVYKRQALFQYYQGNPDELPSDFQTIRLEDGVDRAVCDYIAGMTDPFAVEKYKELFIPKGWTVL